MASYLKEFERVINEVIDDISSKKRMEMQNRKQQNTLIINQFNVARNVVLDISPWLDKNEFSYIINNKYRGSIPEDVDMTPSITILEVDKRTLGPVEVLEIIPVGDMGYKIDGRAQGVTGRHAKNDMDLAIALAEIIARRLDPT